MLIKRLVSLSLSAVMMLSGFSEAVYAASEGSALEYQRYDLTRVERLASAFCDECTKNNNDAAVAQAYYDLIEEYNYAYDATVLSMINYNLRSDEDTYTEYSDSSAVQSKALYTIISALQRSYNETSYSELIGYLCGMDDETSRTELNEDDNQAEKLSFIQRYYDIKLDPDMTAEQKEYSAADLYIEYARCINRAAAENGWESAQDYYYSAYNRDYSYRDTESLGNSVKSEVRDYFNYAVERSRKCSNIAPTRQTLVFEDNIEMLARYASFISDEAAESAALLRDNGLYFQGGDPRSSDLTYTVYLFSRKMPVIYQYAEHTNTDFNTLIHEFGHFNSMNHPSEYLNYIEVGGDCIDIAELQSQGMSVLFTEHYGDIYGRYAKSMELYTLYNMLHTVASAFLVNDIEKYVFENAGEITADDVLSKFEDLKNEYEIINFRLSDINHIFETPFYYISYGVSALAAFELWDEMIRDSDRARSMYTDISHVNIYNTENTFVDSLKSCGFSSDIFDSRTVSDIIENVVYTTAGDRTFGDVDENGAVTGTDIFYLSERIMSAEAVTDERELKKCDLDRDGRIGASDLIVLKKLLLK